MALGNSGERCSFLSRTVSRGSGEGGFKSRGCGYEWISPRAASKRLREPFSYLREFCWQRTWHKQWPVCPPHSQQKRGLQLLPRMPCRTEPEDVDKGSQEDSELGCDAPRCEPPVSLLLTQDCKALQNSTVFLCWPLWPRMYPVVSEAWDAGRIAPARDSGA